MLNIAFALVSNSHQREPFLWDYLVRVHKIKIKSYNKGVNKSTKTAALGRHAYRYVIGIKASLSSHLRKFFSAIAGGGGGNDGIMEAFIPLAGNVCDGHKKN